MGRFCKECGKPFPNAAHNAKLWCLFKRTTQEQSKKVCPDCYFKLCKEVMKSEIEKTKKGIDMEKYSVIVSNIGTALLTDKEFEARKEFNTYVKLSKEKYGKPSGESVTLFDNEAGEIIKEYIGTNPTE